MRRAEEWAQDALFEWLMTDPYPTKPGIEKPSEHEKRQRKLMTEIIAEKIRAAIREALEEAEKVARQFGPANYPTDIWPDEVEGSLDRAGAKMARITSENIAAALAALREPLDD